MHMYQNIGTLKIGPYNYINVQNIAIGIYRGQCAYAYLGMIQYCVLHFPSSLYMVVLNSDKKLMCLLVTYVL